jgi:hypothetical protein
MFVAAADEREDQLGRLGVEADLADLLNHEQRRPEQPAQLLVEASLPLRRCEPGDPCARGREGEALAGQAGRDPERDRQDASRSVKFRGCEDSTSFWRWAVGVGGVGGVLRACGGWSRVIACPV